MKVQFGADLVLSLNLYTEKEFDWRSLDTIHLMINHRSYRASYISLSYLCFFLYSTVSFSFQWILITIKHLPLMKKQFKRILIHLERWPEKWSWLLEWKL